MFLQSQFFICITLLWIQSIMPMSLSNKNSYFMDSNPENQIAEIIYSKSHYPSEKVLPKTSLVKDVDNEVTYLLSKLSDDELIKLLNRQPKKPEYDLNDIVRVIFDPKAIAENQQKFNKYTNKHRELVSDVLNENSNNRFKLDGRAKANPNNMAFFRLEDKLVDPYSTKPNSDSSYNAVQKLNNLLYSYPQVYEIQSGEDLNKKELLFDVLVSQLKSLCCKKSTHYRSQSLKYYPKSKLGKLPNEYIFLVVNEEIKSNGSDDLITVDPESLHRNSSVLLLGPITTPLTDDQLKLVVNRISKELSNPEYLPLLQQLADGTLSDKNSNLMKNIITGPETRRYIKPHRCNHQSKLARIYGGPKWLICTGYLNLNVPSLYD